MAYELAKAEKMSELVTSQQVFQAIFRHDEIFESIFDFWIRTLQSVLLSSMNKHNSLNEKIFFTKCPVFCNNSITWSMFLVCSAAVGTAANSAYHSPNLQPSVGGF